MKEKFLALVEEIKTTGIAEVLCKASNVDEITTAWQKFKNENSELFRKINEWATEFVDGGCNPIFKCNADVEMPMEIAVCIYIMGENATECTIFDEGNDFVKALYATNEKNASAVGHFVYDNFLFYITPEDFFKYEEPDESNGDGEAETGGAKEEVEPGDDGYDAVAPCLGDYFGDDFDLIPGRE